MKIGVIITLVLLVSISFVSASDIFVSSGRVYQEKFISQQLNLPKLFFSSPFLELKQPLVVKELIVVKDKLEEIEAVESVESDGVEADGVEGIVKAVAEIAEIAGGAEIADDTDDLITGDSIKHGAKEIVINEKVIRFETITINVGQEVVWKNEQKRVPALIYGVREISEMKSDNLKAGESFSWTFSEPGEFTYVDSIVIGRIGKIIVQ